MFTSKLNKTKTNSDYSIGHLDKVVWPLVLILPKMSRYLKTFKDKGKYKNNKLMFFCIDDDKLLGKYETICINIEDLQDIKLNALPFYGDRYIEIKVRVYFDTIYAYFHDINVPEDGVECESFTIISIDFYLFMKKIITCKYI